jgi:molybdate transport system permease protein
VPFVIAPLTDINFNPILLSVQLAVVTTVMLLIVGIPLAWWLAQTRWRLRPLVESVIALPLVLPPTVIGFYLLILLGANGPFAWLELAFSFQGLVVGSMIYSLPFVVQPLQNAFQQIDMRQLEAAATLHAAPLDRFLSVALPHAKHGLLSAVVLGFTHTLGEFGIVLMIGGNIPGETRTASIAIYDQVEQLHYYQAHILSAGLLLFCLAVLFLAYIVKDHRQRKQYA